MPFASVNIVGVAERARLFCAAGRVVLWVKIQHHPLALKIGQFYVVAILILSIKIRCLVAFFQHKSSAKWVKSIF